LVAKVTLSAARAGRAVRRAKAVARNRRNISGGAPS
jgi:hypothetical protein